LCDFMSSTLTDQLKLKRKELVTPLTVQLAVLGSRSKINYQVSTEFAYQGIREERTFDIINLSNYDLILGTPNTALPIKGLAVKTLALRAARIREENLDDARTYLKELAAPLCRAAEDTGLPPLRAVNHCIELIDEDRIYPWRPARCPEAFMDQWTTK
ncbi:hypothetical protein HYPSUDRAFT_101808, partial [Hypholoma sublateritium FD-334 SS-4]